MSTDGRESQADADTAALGSPSDLLTKTSQRPEGWRGPGASIQTRLTERCQAASSSKSSFCHLLCGSFQHWSLNLKRNLGRKQSKPWKAQ